MEPPNELLKTKRLSRFPYCLMIRNDLGRIFSGAVPILTSVYGLFMGAPEEPVSRWSLAGKAAESRNSNDMSQEGRSRVFP